LQCLFAIGRWDYLEAGRSERRRREGSEARLQGG
jgi:hypothetical protein